MAEVALHYPRSAPATLAEPAPSAYEERRTLLMRLAAPLMRLMVSSVRRRRPQNGSLDVNHVLFDGIGDLCRKIRYGAASWHALDIIYNYRGDGSVADRLWVGNMRNAQAVRNRKRAIASALREIALNVAARNGHVRILSLASGSAQAVFEGLQRFPYPAEIKLVDFDRAAGPYALELARRTGLENAVSFKAGNVLKFDRQVMLGDFRPDVIEMAGLLDYLHDDEAIDVIRRVHALLQHGGAFITCHIHDNPERDFMTEVIEWGRAGGKGRPMLYRTKAELEKLIHAGGFTRHVVFHTEPHKIHTVAIAHK